MFQLIIKLYYSGFEMNEMGLDLYVTPHHAQKVLLVQFSLYVYKGGLKPQFKFESNLSSEEISFYFNNSTKLIIKSAELAYYLTFADFIL